jgi:hypothetical protein
MFDALSAPRSAPLSSRPSINESLEGEKSTSLNYQILRRTLNLEESAPEKSAPKAEVSQPEVSTEQVSAFQNTLSQRELELNVSVNAQPQLTDPLVLDLASNGFRTSGLSRTVAFDLDGDGKRDQISVPVGDDALLALDRNGNGRIDDGRELFGDQNGAANGFAELSKYDDNGDGRIDRQDAIFERLSLLRFDAQGRQSSQSLSQAGVSAISLPARDVDIALGAYDKIAQLGSFEFADGRSGQAADLLLAQR